MNPGDFTHPPKEYRGAPFWSWNDELQDDELRRQIAEMDEQGLGGFFMHSRVGLATPYMSNEWMDRIRTCVEEAKKRGMQAWLYDEDKWPSGFAGGMVPAVNPEYRQHALGLRPDPRYLEIAESVRVFEARVENGTIVSVRPVDTPPADPMATSKDKLYLHFFLHTGSLGEEWFQGFSYSDNLNPEAVEQYINVNYQPYADLLGDDFGKTAPGIFTDEPNYMSHHGSVPRPRVPWTIGFPEYFKEKNGYDIRDYLPSLFYDLPDCEKARYDFWSTVTDRFVEAYTKQLGDWCVAHGAQLTGHVLLEDKLLTQIRVTGAAMPHYEYMQLPGMDHLGRNIWDWLTPKQLDSVACQLGKPRVLSELYGTAGQNFSFEGRKWIGDWHVLLGVNLLNHHLSLYSMRGARKRDYPPVIFYQQPWWKYNYLVDDYFARLCFALTRGQRQVDVLMIHPMASAWAKYKPENPRAVQELDDVFATLTEDMLKIHRDYHLGDEKIMARHASVEGATFKVGLMSYKVVIVPPGVALARTTMELLTKFVENGGQLIALQPTPSTLEGRPSAKLYELWRKPGVHIIPCDRLTLDHVLNFVLPRDVDVVDEVGNRVDSIWYHHRTDGDQDIYFFANTDPCRDHDTVVTVRAEGRVEEWDANTGDVTPLPIASAGGGLTALRLRFEQAGSHLVVVTRNAAPLEAPEPAGQVVREQTLSDTWLLQRQDHNALTLDYCQYRIKDDPWSERVPVWQADLNIRTCNEAWQRTEVAGNWFTVQAGIELPFALKYQFDVDFDLDVERELYLVMETPERFNILVNGAKVETNGQYWRDISFKMIDISGLVRPGENIIEVSGLYYHDTELESCYIVGDFAVEMDEDGASALLDEGDFVQGERLELQGYTFFAGTVSLAQSVEANDEGGRVYFECGRLDATVARVLVNGEEAGLVYWNPYRVDITDLLHPGSNVVEVELTNTLHNLLGPHHNTLNEILRTSPENFTDREHWTDDYFILPFGIGQARLIWRA